MYIIFSTARGETQTNIYKTRKMLQNTIKCLPSILELKAKDTGRLG